MLPVMAVAFAFAFAACDTGTRYVYVEVPGPEVEVEVDPSDPMRRPAFLEVDGAFVRYLMDSVRPREGHHVGVILMIEDLSPGSPVRAFAGTPDGGAFVLPEEGGTFPLFTDVNARFNMRPEAEYARDFRIRYILVDYIRGEFEFDFNNPRNGQVPRVAGPADAQFPSTEFTGYITLRGDAENAAVINESQFYLSRGRALLRNRMDATLADVLRLGRFVLPSDVESVRTGINSGADRIRRIYRNYSHVTFGHSYTVFRDFEAATQTAPGRYGVDIELTFGGESVTERVDLVFGGHDSRQTLAEAHAAVTAWVAGRGDSAMGWFPAGYAAQASLVPSLEAALVAAGIVTNPNIRFDFSGLTIMEMPTLLPGWQDAEDPEDYRIGGEIEGEILLYYWDDPDEPVDVTVESNFGFWNTQIAAMVIADRGTWAPIDLWDATVGGTAAGIWNNPVGAWLPAVDTGGIGDAATGRILGPAIVNTETGLFAPERSVNTQLRYVLTRRNLTWPIGAVAIPPTNAAQRAQVQINVGSVTTGVDVVPPVILDNQGVWTTVPRLVTVGTSPATWTGPQQTVIIRPDVRRMTNPQQTLDMAVRELELEFVGLQAVLPGPDSPGVPAVPARAPFVIGNTWAEGGAAVLALAGELVTSGMPGARVVPTWIIGPSGANPASGNPGHVQGVLGVGGRMVPVRVNVTPTAIPNLGTFRGRATAVGLLSSVGSSDFVTTPQTMVNVDFSDYSVVAPDVAAAGNAVITLRGDVLVAGDVVTVANMSAAGLTWAITEIDVVPVASVTIANTTGMGTLTIPHDLTQGGRIVVTPTLIVGTQVVIGEAVTVFVTAR